MKKERDEIGLYITMSRAEKLYYKRLARQHGLSFKRFILLAMKNFDKKINNFLD